MAFTPGGGTSGSLSRGQRADAARYKAAAKKSTSPARQNNRSQTADAKRYAGQAGKGPKYNTNTKKGPNKLPIGVSGKGRDGTRLKPSAKQTLAKMETRKKATKLPSHTSEGQRQMAKKDERKSNRRANAKKTAQAVARGANPQKSLTKIPTKKSSTKFQRNQAIRQRAADIRAINKQSKRASQTKSAQSATKRATTPSKPAYRSAASKNASVRQRTQNKTK